MKTKKQRIVAWLLAMCMMMTLVMPQALAAPSFGRDKIELVEDVFSISVPAGRFFAVDLGDEADHEEGYVATYRQRREDAMDFDVYVWENGGMNLRQTVQEETDGMYGFTIMNGVAMAYYYGKDEGYDSLTVIFDLGDTYAELVFFYDSYAERKDAWDIINTAAAADSAKAKPVTTIEAGDCTLTLKGYYEGCRDVYADDESQIGYYFSLDSDIDFDAYCWPADEEDTDLETAVWNEIEAEHEGQGIVPETAALNGFDVMYYDSVSVVEEYGESVEYSARTYIMLVDGIFYEIEFFADCTDAAQLAEVEAILSGLTVAQQKLELVEDTLWVVASNSFYPEDMGTPEDYEEGYVTTYRQADEDAMDFDLYVWANEGETLTETAEAETAEEITYLTINGVDTASYYEYDAQFDTDTLTVIFDLGDTYAELVFYIGDEADDLQAWRIVESLEANVADPDPKPHFNPAVLAAAAVGTAAVGTAAAVGTTVYFLAPVWKLDAQITVPADAVVEDITVTIAREKDGKVVKTLDLGSDTHISGRVAHGTYTVTVNAVKNGEPVCTAVTCKAGPGAKLPAIVL